MFPNHIKKVVVLALFAFVFIGVFGVSDAILAQGVPGGYVPLEPLPLLGDGGAPVQTDVGGYIQTLFRLAIGGATVLAVLLIVVGGIEYMASETVGGKGEATKRMQNAVWGFILAISSVLILETINPNLLNLNLGITGIRLIPPQQTVETTYTETIPTVETGPAPHELRITFPLGEGCADTFSYNNQIYRRVAGGDLPTGAEGRARCRYLPSTAQVLTDVSTIETVVRVVDSTGVQLRMPLVNVGSCGRMPQTVRYQGELFENPVRRNTQGGNFCFYERMSGQY